MNHQESPQTVLGIISQFTHLAWHKLHWNRRDPGIPYTGMPTTPHITLHRNTGIIGSRGVYFFNARIQDFHIFFMRSNTYRRRHMKACSTGFESCSYLSQSRDVIFHKCWGLEAKIQQPKDGGGGLGAGRGSAIQPSSTYAPTNHSKRIPVPQGLNYSSRTEPAYQRAASLGGLLVLKKNGLPPSPLITLSLALHLTLFHHPHFLSIPFITFLSPNLV
jgi:hypothetical protein